MSRRDIILKRHTCIKFCLKITKSATETFNSIKLAFEGNALNRCVIFDRYQRFEKVIHVFVSVFPKHFTREEVYVRYNFLFLLERDQIEEIRIQTERFNTSIVKTFLAPLLRNAKFKTIF